MRSFEISEFTTNLFHLLCCQLLANRSKFVIYFFSLPLREAVRLTAAAN